MKTNQILSRRDFIKLAGGMAASAVLASCTPKATEKAAQPGEAPVDQTPPAMVVEINFWSPSCDTTCELPITKIWTDKYMEANPNVKIKLAGPPWGDYWTKLPLEVAAGTGPELFYFHPNWVQQFVDGGMLAEWPDDALAELRKEIDPAFIPEYNGKKFYAKLLGMTNGIIYYHEKLWSEAGLTEKDFPTSWPELTKLARELTILDSSGEVKRAGFQWHRDKDIRWSWVSLKYQTGEWMVSQDGRKAYHNTEGARQAAQMLLDWQNKDKIGSVLMPDPPDAFASDQIVMAYGPGWFMGWFEQSIPDVKIGAFKSPSLDGKPAPVYTTVGYEITHCVNSQAKSDLMPYAFDIAKFYALDLDTMRYMAKTGTAPVHKSLQNDQELLSTPVVKAQLDIIDRCYDIGPTPPDYETTYNVFTDAVLGAVPTMGMDEALAESQKKADEVLAKPETVYWGSRDYKYADEMHDPELKG